MLYNVLLFPKHASSMNMVENRLLALAIPSVPRHHIIAIYRKPSTWPSIMPRQMSTYDKQLQAKRLLFEANRQGRLVKFIFSFWVFSERRCLNNTLCLPEPPRASWRLWSLPGASQSPPGAPPRVPPEAPRGLRASQSSTSNSIHLLQYD